MDFYDLFFFNDLHNVSVSFCIEKHIVQSSYLYFEVSYCANIHFDGIGFFFCLLVLPVDDAIDFRYPEQCVFLLSYSNVCCNKYTFR